MGNIEFFNELARRKILSNARMPSLDFGVYERTFADIDRKVEFLPEDLVLDVGGGVGQISGLIAKKSREVVLADGAEEALRLAREILKASSNVSYEQVDLETQRLPFADSRFDKVICYSVIHYLKDHKSLEQFLVELLRITKSGGKIFLGDVPLADKGKLYLKERKKYPLKNFLANLKYYGKKWITILIYRFLKVNEKQVSGMALTRDNLGGLLGEIQGITYQWLKQDPNLPFANSREDLLIVKTT